MSSYFESSNKSETNENSESKAEAVITETVESTKEAVDSIGDATEKQDTEDYDDCALESVREGVGKALFHKSDEIDEDYEDCGSVPSDVTETAVEEYFEDCGKHNGDTTEKSESPDIGETPEKAPDIESALKEPVGGVLDMVDVSGAEIDALRESQAYEIQSKQDEKSATEAALKVKFDEVVSKEKGSEEYYHLLQEYNVLQAKKSTLDEQLASLKEQQDLLDQKGLELGMQIESLSAESAVGDKSPMDQLSEYMSLHNYGMDDFDTYSQDPQWRALHQQAFPDYELPPLKTEVPVLEDIGELSPEQQAAKIAEYKKSLEDYCESNGFVETADFSDFDPKVAQAMTESVVEAKKDFPELDVNYLGTIDSQVKGMHSALEQRQYDMYIQCGFSEELASEMARDFADEYIRCNKLDQVDGTYAWSLSSSDPSLEKYNGVAINDEYAKDYEYFRSEKAYDEEVNWAPEGCGTPKAVTDHEMGHEIDKLLDASSDPVIINMYEDMVNNNNATDELSGYSEKSVQEFIAEAYSEYKNNPNPRPTSVAVYNRLIELRDSKN